MNNESVPTIMNWPMAFVISLPTILGIATLIIGYLNNKGIKIVSEKQESLSHKVNGLKDELVKSSKEEGRSAGVIEGVQIEQDRTANNLAVANKNTVRLEEIRGQSRPLV